MSTTAGRAWETGQHGPDCTGSSTCRCGSVQRHSLSRWRERVMSRVQHLDAPEQRREQSRLLAVALNL
jgi:hypothetical protein